MKPVITKRKYNRGRFIPPQWAVGKSCRRTTKFLIVSVPDRRKVTLLDVIKRHVIPGTLILIDFQREYRNIGSHPYHHLTVIHSRNFVNPLNSTIYTQNIENLESVLKRFLRKNGTNRKMSYPTLVNLCLRMKMTLIPLMFYWKYDL